MTEPLVSVVIPAFNAAATLGETLDSVVAQSFTDWECVVVDDGSQDDTVDLVQEYCAADSRIRIVAQSNAGVATARNLGIAEARGHFVAPVDADDLWHPTKLQKQLDALNRFGSQAKIAYCWYAVIDTQNHIIEHSDKFRFEGDIFRRLCMGNLLGNGSTALMSRDAVLEVGGYDRSLQDRGAFGCEDLALYLALAERHQFALVPEYLVGYRWVPGNMSSGALRMLRSYDLTMESYEARYPDYADDFRLGRYYLIDWLIGREKATGSTRQLIALLLEMAKVSPVRAARLASTAPLSVLRQRRRYRDASGLKFPANC